MIVLRVGLEMLGQRLDSAGQDCDLDFGRAGVVLPAAMVLDHFVFVSAVIDIGSLLFLSKVEPAHDLEAVGRCLDQRDRRFAVHRQSSPGCAGIPNSICP